MKPNAEMVISLEMLRQILDLPEGVTVVCAAEPRKEDRRSDVFRLAVNVDYLPTIEDRDGRPFIVTPIYRSVEPCQAHFHELHVTP